MADEDENLEALFEQVAAMHAHSPAIELLPVSAPLSLSGELTVDVLADVNPGLQDALVEAKQQQMPMRLHVGAITACDTAGLQLLLVMAIGARAAGTTLELCDATAAMVSMLDRFGLSRYFNVRPTGWAQ